MQEYELLCTGCIQLPQNIHTQTFKTFGKITDVTLLEQKYFLYSFFFLPLMVLHFIQQQKT